MDTVPNEAEYPKPIFSRSSSWRRLLRTFERTWKLRVRCSLRVSAVSEDTCMSYEEEDTCMSYEEEDTCLRVSAVSEERSAPSAVCP